MYKNNNIISAISCNPRQHAAGSLLIKEYLGFFRAPGIRAFTDLKHFILLTQEFKVMAGETDNSVTGFQSNFSCFLAFLGIGKKLRLSALNKNNLHFRLLNWPMNMRPS